MDKGKEVVKFFRHYVKFSMQGQGNITIHCPRLWEMTDEEFDKTFNLETKNNHPTKQTVQKGSGDNLGLDLKRSDSVSEVKTGDSQNLKITEDKDGNM